jgi:hypothetical protein
MDENKDEGDTKSQNISVSDTVCVRSALVATKHSGGREAGIRYSDSDGHAASADLDPDGSAIVGVQGVVPSGEAYELPTAQIFVEYQRGLGGHLEEPHKFEGAECGIDCIAENKDNRSEPLHMQITNAFPDTAYWKKQKHSIERDFRELPVDKRVSHLWEALDKKRHRHRKDTILLLSAWLSLAHATTEVVKRFRAVYGREARLVGFKEVWVVGVNTSHTFRLDID